MVKVCRKCGKKLYKNNTTGYCVNCIKLEVHKCIELNCDNKVWKEGNRCCNCRAKGKNNGNYKHGNNCKGKIHYCIEKDCKEKVSGPDKRCKKHGYKNAGLKRRKPKKIYYCIEPNCTNKVSGPNKRCLKCANKGKKNSNYKDGNHVKGKIYYCIEPNCNKKVSDHDRRCHHCDRIKRYSDPKEREKMSNSLKNIDGETKQKRRLKAIGRIVSEETRNKLRIGCKKRWEDIDYKNRVIKNWMKSCAIKPNKKEVLLDNLLHDILPKEYKYVGNGEVILNGFNPDFININGQKKIIELFGDYWHNLPDAKKRDIERLNAYKSLGYKTLIIWEHELGKKRTINRILKFNGAKT